MIEVFIESSHTEQMLQTCWKVLQHLTSVPVCTIVLWCNKDIILSFAVSKVENESFPCMHNLGERTGQEQYSTTRQSSPVRTHEKNSGDAVRRLGTIIQSIFVPNQEPAFAWPFGNALVRVGTQGLFRPCLKLSSRPFSRPDWLRLGLWGWALQTPAILEVR